MTLNGPKDIKIHAIVLVDFDQFHLISWFLATGKTIFFKHFFKSNFENFY